MSWITNFVRPKIKALISKQDMPDNMWQNCPGCNTMLYQQELKNNSNVCSNCGHHMRMDVIDRITMLFDGGDFQEEKFTIPVNDPLKFKDIKKYSDRLKDAQSKRKRDDAIVIAQGMINGVKTVIAAFDFNFMGGSMSVGVGEGLLAGSNLAVKLKAPLVIISSSGGARMQESVLSLMQMPRSIIAVEQVKEAGLPFISVLADPTTGGVSASFAMLGDIHIAEPGAMIGFAGRRVIEETIRQELPKDFQTAEYLKDHGMVDMVVPRHELAKELGKVLKLLMMKKI